MYANRWNFDETFIQKDAVKEMKILRGTIGIY